MMTKQDLAKILASQRQQRQRKHTARTNSSHWKNAIPSTMILIGVITGTLLIFLPNQSPIMEAKNFQPNRPAPTGPHYEVAVVSPALHRTVCTGLDHGSLHVRKDAGADSEVLGYLSEGTKVESDPAQAVFVIGKSEWIRISAPLEGWVNIRYLCHADQ